ncbi:transglutaminase domain-containing protein [Heyndrickxia sporothermodurans]|uniref:transglutaminase domain-containing protein n=2 Tax=Heyndrickxia sporothermodurans TaxID=46224 RepID=UPI0035E2BCFE
MPIKKIFLYGLLSVLFLSAAACSHDANSKTSSKKENKQETKAEKENAKYAALVKEKNSELDLKPITLTNYSEKVGATITNPKYNAFAVNKELEITGKIEKHELLKEKYVWVKVSSLDVIDSNSVQEYYIPIKNGQFSDKIHFYNGEGKYSVHVMLPATDRENYYYDLSTFEVVNVNPIKQRDLTYTPFAQEAQLTLDTIKSGFMSGKELITVGGTIKEQTSSKNIMIEVKKDSNQWKHEIPIKNGKFSYEVPLFYGKGIHQINVLVPDQQRENYYQYGTTLFVDNQSDRTMKPIEYYRTYEERGITLNTPQFGGDQAKLTYHIKGQIDPNAKFAKETTHIYVKTKKGNDEALDIIPVKHFNFDDSIYLRFGPGEYEVSINVPEIKEEKSNYFRYFSVASFSVENMANEDKRDLLPSRGIPSDDPKIINLAKKITKDRKNNFDKAKAIYKYTAKTISYDVAKFKNNEFEWDDNALKTLKLKTGVCQDYAYLAGALLRASNIEARVITGKAGTGLLKENHAWIEAKINGKWLTMDPTWGAGFVQNDKFVAKYTDKYFQPNMNEFNKTHLRDKVEY